MLPPLPKLADLFRARDVADLAKRVYEWVSAAQDLLRALRASEQDLETRVAEIELNGGGGSATVSFGIPGSIAPDDAISGGVATTAARSDHKHGIVAAPPGSLTPGDTAAEGAASSFARSDHTHGWGLEDQYLGILAAVSIQGWPR